MQKGSLWLYESLTKGHSFGVPRNNSRKSIQVSLHKLRHRGCYLQWALQPMNNYTKKQTDHYADRLWDTFEYIYIYFFFSCYYWEGLGTSSRRIAHNAVLIDTWWLKCQDPSECAGLFAARCNKIGQARLQIPRWDDCAVGIHKMSESYVCPIDACLEISIIYLYIIYIYISKFVKFKHYTSCDKTGPPAVIMNIHTLLASIKFIWNTPLAGLTGSRLLSRNHPQSWVKSTEPEWTWTPSFRAGSTVAQVPKKAC